MSLSPHDSWGRLYAEERLAPMLEHAAAGLDGTVKADVGRVVKRCARGDFDDGDRRARLHGDLWSGNVMWTEAGGVLIDPAAHSGRETDLAMLALFGARTGRGRRRFRARIHSEWLSGSITLRRCIHCWRVWRCSEQPTARQTAAAASAALAL